MTNRPETPPRLPQSLERNQRPPHPPVRTDWDGIKQRHRLADVVRRSGLDVGGSGRVMVCCPTPGHDDFTPSMQVDLDRDRYWCFGCDSHGDVIDWVRDIEGVDTPTAIAILESRRPIAAVFKSATTRRACPRAGHETPRLDRTPQPRVAAANAFAWRYYSYETLHERGVAYLTGRALNVGALERELSAAVVGHTPSSKSRIDGLVTFLTGKGFSQDELVDSGLATRCADGCVIDFFRDRAILPVKDAAGAVVGLLGRDVTDRSKVKYLNQPITATYHKSLVLYRPSTPPLDAQASTVVCEGPLDALAMAAQAATSHLSRYFAPVAACGRGLSDTQIHAILTIHPRAPVLAADGDQPGREANLDWANRMLAKGRESVITTWPEGHDPGSWIATRGPGGLLAVTRRGCLDDTTGVLRPRHCGAVLTEYAFAAAARHGPPDRNQIIEAISKATANLGPAARHRYITAVASAFELEPSLLGQDPAGTSRRYLARTSLERAGPFRTRPDPFAAATPETLPTERIPI